MGMLQSWTVLWLYPRTVTEANAATLATSVFGASITATAVAGRPAWQNDCFETAVECVAGLAIWLDGRFLLLEASTVAGPKADEEARARDVLERVVAGRGRSG